MKITTKTTKEQLKSFLGANAKAVKTADKDLFDQIAYADKMAKKDDSKVGFPICLISAGLLALAFMGFSGMKIF